FTADGREKFGTYTRDNPGQDYADQRYYGVGTGRFNTPDPSLNSNADVLPGNWNRYAYVGGDPINKTDPSGLCSPEDNPPCYSVTGTPAPGGNGIPVGSTNDPRYAMAYAYMAGNKEESDDEHPREHRTPQQMVTDAVMRGSDRLFNVDCAGIFL